MFVRLFLVSSDSICAGFIYRKVALFNDVILRKKTRNLFCLLLMYVGRTRIVFIGYNLQSSSKHAVVNEMTVRGSCSPSNFFVCLINFKIFHVASLLVTYFKLIFGTVAMLVPRLIMSYMSI